MRYFKDWKKRIYYTLEGKKIEKGGISNKGAVMKADEFIEKMEKLNEKMDKMTAFPVLDQISDEDLLRIPEEEFYKVFDDVVNKVEEMEKYVFERFSSVIKKTK